MFKKATTFVKNWHSIPSIKRLLSIEGINFGKVLEVYLFNPIVRILGRKEEARQEKEDKIFLLESIFFHPIESLELTFYFLPYYFRSKLVPTRKVKNPILFLARRHSLFRLLPIFVLMKKRKIPFKILIWAPSRKEWLFLFKNNLEFQILGKKSDKKQLSKSKKKAEALLGNWRKIKRRKILDIFLKQQDLTRFKKSIENCLDKFFKKHSFNFCQTVYEAIEIIIKMKPCLFVCTDDLNPVASIFVHEFKKNKLPTLLIQHGMIGNLRLSNFISDKIAVWGDYTKKVLVGKLRRDPRAIVVTGNPFFDQSYPRYRYKPRFAGLRKKQRVFAILTTFYDDSKKEVEILEKILLSLTSFKDVKIRVRTHPGQEISLIKEFIRRKNLKIKINEAISLQEFVKSSDLLLAQDTSTGVEVILLGKPLVYLNLMGEKDSMPYAKFKAAVGVYKTATLKLKIKKLLKSKGEQKAMQKGQRQFIKEYLRLDGKSASRILDLIKKSAKRYF